MPCLRLRCACNSRLNLVRLFVNPPHPARARTPPWGCLCARCACACPPGCLFLCVPVCAACARLSLRLCVHTCACLCALPVVPVRAVRLAACARGVRLLPARFLGCVCPSGALACFVCWCALRLLLRMLSALCWYYSGLFPPSLMPGGSLSAVLAVARPSLLSW